MACASCCTFTRLTLFWTKTWVFFFWLILLSVDAFSRWRVLRVTSLKDGNFWLNNIQLDFYRKPVSSINAGRTAKERKPNRKIYNWNQIHQVRKELHSTYLLYIVSIWSFFLNLSYPSPAFNKPRKRHPISCTRALGAPNMANSLSLSSRNHHQPYTSRASNLVILCTSKTIIHMLYI